MQRRREVCCSNECWDLDSYRVALTHADPVTAVIVARSMDELRSQLEKDTNRDEEESDDEETESICVFSDEWDSICDKERSGEYLHVMNFI